MSLTITRSSSLNIHSRSEQGQHLICIKNIYDGHAVAGQIRHNLTFFYGVTNVDSSPSYNIIIFLSHKWQISLSDFDIDTPLGG